MTEIKYDDDGQIEYIIVDGERKNYLDGNFNIDY